VAKHTLNRPVSQHIIDDLERKLAQPPTPKLRREMMQAMVTCGLTTDPARAAVLADIFLSR